MNAFFPLKELIPALIIYSEFTFFQGMIKIVIIRKKKRQIVPVVGVCNLELLGIFFEALEYVT